MIIVLGGFPHLNFCFKTRASSQLYQVTDHQSVGLNVPPLALRVGFLCRPLSPFTFHNTSLLSLLKHSRLQTFLLHCFHRNTFFKTPFVWAKVGRCFDNSLRSLPSGVVFHSKCYLLVAVQQSIDIHFFS